MARLFWIRFLAIAVTALVTWTLPKTAFETVIFSVIFSHYLVAAFYSRQRAGELWADEHARVRLALPGAIALGLMLLDTNIMIVVFGIHHLWNEGYAIHNRENYRATVPPAFRFAFEAAVYIAATSADWAVAPNAAVVTGWLTLTGAGLMYRVARVRRELGADWKWDLAFTAAGVTLAGLCLSHPGSGLDQALMYHFVFWSIYPVDRIRASGGARAVHLYIGVNLSALALTAPVGLLPLFGLMTVPALNWLTRMGAYAHIFSSVSLSVLHPLFIRNFFARASAPADPRPAQTRSELSRAG